MADEEFELKAGVDQFQTASDVLGEHLATLEGIVKEYDEMENNVSQFMEGEDSNFDNMRNSVRNNAKMVQGELEVVKRLKEKIDDTVSDLTQTATNIEGIITDSADSAIKVANSAIKLDELGLL